MTPLEPEQSRRIPQEELARLKRDIDLAALIRSKDVELKPQGKDLIGLCPFHNDTNPSLIVTPEKNLWHCLGACNAGGSVIDWIMGELPPCGGDPSQRQCLIIGSFGKDHHEINRSPA
ncbi:MAG: hypothetical protein JW795_06550 [Chitinivibrionales bacterium]|nr:hypothetical protein [Chitinivibrionales bacterium]